MLAGRGLVIDHVMKDSPAHQAGLQTGDFIVSINTRSLSGLSADQMLSILETEGRERLIVDVLREGSKQTVKLHKGAFAVPQVTQELISSIPSTGVLQIQFFGEQSSVQVKNRLKRVRIHSRSQR